VLNALTYGAGLFVAVGGGFSTSADGLTWRSQGGGGSISPLRAIAFGSGKFLVAGDAGTLLTSEDATNWVSQQHGIKIISEDILFAKDTFVVVGAADTLITSTDGADWTVRDSATNYCLRAIAYGDGKFIAIGEYYDTPRNIFLLSTDGITWARQTNQFSTSSFSAISFGNGLFLATGDNALITSPDGTNWTSHTTGLNAYINKILYTNGLFVAACAYGKILTSGDGLGWISRYTGVSQNLNGITFAQGLFVSVGDSCVVLTSPDGITWTRHNFTTDSYSLYSVLYVGGQFLIPSAFHVCWVSNDTTNWVRRFFFDPPDLRKLAYGKNSLVGIDGNNAIMQSGHIDPTLCGDLGPDGLKLTLAGGLAQGSSTSIVYQIQNSADLTSWAFLASVTNWQGTVHYLDPASRTAPQRFYRLLLR